MTTLAPFYPRAGQEYLIQTAREMVQTECLNSHGVSAVAGGANLSKQLEAERQSDDRLYGISDLTLARRYGFSPSPTLVPGSDTSIPAPVSAPAKAAPATAAPTGANDVLQRCILSALSTIYGGDQYNGFDPFQLGHSLSVKAWLDSKSDPRVVASWNDWRTCMKGKGYNPPGDPINPQLYPIRTGEHQAPPDEVAAAVTDINCKSSTSLISRWSAVVDELEHQAYTGHQAALDADRQHLAQTVARARSVRAAH